MRLTLTLPVLVAMAAILGAQTPGAPGVNYFSVSVGGGAPVPVAAPAANPCASVTIPINTLTVFKVETTSPLLMTLVLVKVSSPCVGGFLPLPPSSCFPGITHSVDLLPGSVGTFFDLTMPGVTSPGELSIPLVFTPAFSGLTLSAQGLIFDANCGTPILMTNAINVTIS